MKLHSLFPNIGLMGLQNEGLGKERLVYCLKLLMSSQIREAQLRSPTSAAPLKDVPCIVTKTFLENSSLPTKELAKD